MVHLGNIRFVITSKFPVQIVRSFVILSINLKSLRAIAKLMSSVVVLMLHYLGFFPCLVRAMSEQWLISRHLVSEHATTHDLVQPGVQPSATPQVSGKYEFCNTAFELACNFDRKDCFF